jgi:hypothetical protein
MPEYEGEFIKIIKLLSDNDLLDHVIVIGSWSEFLYQRTGMIPPNTTALRTLDVDILVRNLRKPEPPVNFESIAREAGYVVDNDVLLGTTKIKSASRLEIEFLITQKGAGAFATYRSALGVTAQALRGLDLLLYNTVTVDYFDMKITVPTPEAYVLHKILINASRNSNAKREKDRGSIIALYPHLNKIKFCELIAQSTKKQLRAIKEFMDNNQELDINIP